MMKYYVRVLAALGHKEMEMAMEVDPVAKCLDSRDNPGHELAPRDSLEITDQGAKSAAAEWTQELPVVLEEEPEHPGDGEDNLAVGDIQKESLPHPLGPFLPPLRMARRAKRDLSTIQSIER
ncbi:MAG: hypothetical protein R6X21_06250 [Candidatus Aminicenantes bacterium]